MQWPRHLLRVDVWAIVGVAVSAAIAACAAPAEAGARRAELETLLTKIDMKLYEQCEADVRAWLDQRVETYGEFGVYPFRRRMMKILGDKATLDLNRGGYADAAAQFFRAYEILGDKKYLGAGLRTADFYMRIQQPAGHFPRHVSVTRGGEVTVEGSEREKRTARIQDGYQFRPFALLLYAYKLAGEKKYFDAAKRCADLIITIQNPKNGSCPDYFDLGHNKRDELVTGTRGVGVGGAYNDFATTDAVRMTLLMYHLTRDRKYLVRTAKVGQWIFDTQLGKGKVRGWCQQYGPDNKPAHARGFETAVIGPRTFNRFIGPTLTWFYAMTGRERYRTLLAESCQWLRSVKHPEGWAYQYLPDGTEVYSEDGEIRRYDKLNASRRRRRYSIEKVQLDDTVQVLGVLAKGGLQGLRKWYSGPTKHTPEQYLGARLAAARRATDEGIVVPLAGPNELNHGAIRGKYLERVRQRWMRPDAPGMPKTDGIGRTGPFRQSWQSIHNWTEPYRPPFGWAQWQYVCDARLALGKTDPAAAATGGRGLEAMHYYEPWDVMGDWTSRAVEVEDWMALPLAGLE